MYKIDLLMRQFRYEIESYKRMLHFYSEENILFKKRLSDFINASDSTNNEFMEQVEYFHTYLLKEDEYIEFLQSELADQETLLVQPSDKDSEKEILKNQLKLRKELQFVEDDFHKLTFNLNSYMSSFYSSGLANSNYHFM